MYKFDLVVYLLLILMISFFSMIGSIIVSFITVLYITRVVYKKKYGDKKYEENNIVVDIS